MSKWTRALFKKRYHGWLVHRLCDLHTLLDLALFRVEDWLRKLDPSRPRTLPRRQHYAVPLDVKMTVSQEGGVIREQVVTAWLYRHA